MPDPKPTEKKSIAVVAAIIESNGKILCVQRGPHRLPYIRGVEGLKVEGRRSG